MLRALTGLRSAGWGIALDDVGGDSRSLALMSILYPDVIKLDLRLLADAPPEDVARIVTAVGAEAERRHATVLAEGIDSEEQLAHARARSAPRSARATCSARPAPLPDPLPPPGRAAAARRRRRRPVRRDAVGARDELAPPDTGPGRLAGRARRALILDQAAELGQTAMVLAALADEDAAADARRALRLAAGPRRVRRRPQRRRVVRRQRRPQRRLGADDPLLGTGTLVALAPDFAACFVARRTGEDEWAFAITYDRDTVVECALPLMARMEPLTRSAATRAASSAMTFESCPPCQASGELPGSSERSSAPGIASA